MKMSAHRSKGIAGKLIGISIAYEPDNLLARGLGLEHLRELLLRLARPLVRQGALLVYGGYWKEVEDNFTYDLLRLISAELQDNSLGGAKSKLPIKHLINHSSWPHYLDISPKIEAQWIDCCQIVRVTQQDAGLSKKEIVADADAKSGSDRALFNAAVTISATRRLMINGMSIKIPEVGGKRLPPTAARVVQGGKIKKYSGFLPGIFEEALLTMEKRQPMYLLGGFGGASEVLAQAILEKPGSSRPAEFTSAWHTKESPGFARLSEMDFTLPKNLRPATETLDDLYKFVEKARVDLEGTLQTGLTREETRQLLETRDVNLVVRLVRKGLVKQLKLKDVPA